MKLTATKLEFMIFHTTDEVPETHATFDVETALAHIMASARRVLEEQAEGTVVLQINVFDEEDERLTRYMNQPPPAPDDELEIEFKRCPGPLRWPPALPPNFLGVIYTKRSGAEVEGVAVREKGGTRRFRVRRCLHSICSYHPDSENWLHAEVVELS